jgi:prepilin-type processing-associated H-X9-DG protein
MSTKRKAFSCKEDWYVICILIIILGMLFPLLSSIFGHGGHSRSRARRISCTSNLKQIGLSLKQYAMDYDDFFPPENNSVGMDKLRELDYLTDYGVYTCPDTITTKGSGADLLVEANCDYIYMGGAKEGDNPDTPLAFDKPSNHSNYINVLFLDGHVKGYPVPGLINCENVIIFLNSEHSYPPKVFKKLSDKAKKIDTALLMPASPAKP